MTNLQRSAEWANRDAYAEASSNCRSGPGCMLSFRHAGHLPREMFEAGWNARAAWEAENRSEVISELIASDYWHIHDGPDEIEPHTLNRPMKGKTVTEQTEPWHDAPVPTEQPQRWRQVENTGADDHGIQAGDRVTFRPAYMPDGLPAVVAVAYTDTADDTAVAGLETYRLAAARIDRIERPMPPLPPFDVLPAGWYASRDAMPVPMPGDLLMFHPSTGWLTGLGRDGFGRASDLYEVGNLTPVRITETGLDL
jgi:hypothetical protein